MPLWLQNEDITKIQCDAIVNPSDFFFSGLGGADRAIHTAAGPALDEECRTLPFLHTGTVAVTDGYNLPCRYIIHTEGPIWQGGDQDEAVLLRSCYINALLKAGSMGLTSVAFPLISSGTFGFPKDKVLRIAIDAVTDYFEICEDEPEVTICICHKDAYTLSCELALKEYLDGRSPAADTEFTRLCLDPYDSEPFTPSPAFGEELSDWIKRQDDSFPVMLGKLIDMRGMKDSHCYKKANIDRRVFHRIMTAPGYHPSKNTVLCFAVALELTVEETEQLLRSAGYSLSRSSKSDLIVEFHIANGIYNIHEINAALYQYDQECLGNVIR